MISTDTSNIELLSIVIAIVFVAFMAVANIGHENDMWNNGICPKDGTHWEYDNSYMVGKHLRYFYKCEEGHILILTYKK